MNNNDKLNQLSEFCQSYTKNADILTKEVAELNRVVTDFYETVARELQIYKKALELAVLTQCNKSRQDLIKQICKFNFTSEVYDFFLRQAQKELEGDANERQ